MSRKYTRDIPEAILMVGQTDDSVNNQNITRVYDDGAVSVRVTDSVSVVEDTSREAVYRFLDTNGDGTGSIDAAVNGASTNQRFWISPPLGGGVVFALERVIVFLSDSGSLDSGLYGNGINLGVGQGLLLQKTSRDGTTVLNDLMAGQEIRTNLDWTKYAYDKSPFSYGSGEEGYAVRWTFSKAGQSLYIHDDEALSLFVRGNLSGLNNHTFHVQGRVINT